MLDIPALLIALSFIGIICAIVVFARHASKNPTDDFFSPDPHYGVSEEDWMKSIR